MNGKGILSVGNDGFIHEAQLVQHGDHLKLTNVIRTLVSCLSKVSFIWHIHTNNESEHLVVSGYHGNKFV
jgi:hypothetical protein